MTPIGVRDWFIPTAAGRLFARSWGLEPGVVKPPFLLFHDSLGCVDLWRSFPKALAAATGHPTIAYDRLGFGRSDPHPETLRVGFVAKEAATVVPLIQEQMGFRRFIACGHSIGGGMAVETAARHGADCLAVITIGAQAFVEKDHTLVGIQNAKEEFAKEENLARLYKYHGEKSRWVVDAWTDTWLSSAFADWNLDAAVAQLRCPLLAIHGELDEYGSAAHPKRLAGAHGEAKILPGIGHVPFREDEERVVHIIKDFIERMGLENA